MSLSIVEPNDIYFEILTGPVLVDVTLNLTVCLQVWRLFKTDNKRIILWFLKITIDIFSALIAFYRSMLLFSPFDANICFDYRIPIRLNDGASTFFLFIRECIPLPVLMTGQHGRRTPWWGQSWTSSQLIMQLEQ